MHDRLLTEDEMQRLFDGWRFGLWRVMEEARNEPTLHIVRYAAVHNSVTYIAPTSYYWGENTSPSDCTWIVPGAEDNAR